MKFWKNAGFRKKCLWTVILVLCVCTVPGCTGKKETRKEPVVELELMMRKREDMDSMQKLVDAFHASQNRIRIRINIVPNVDMELRVRAVEESLPDLIQFNGLQARETMEFVQGGYLADLSGEPFMSRVKDELIPYLRYNGEFTLFPMTLSYEGIYVNEAILKQNGYEIPETYEELIHIAEGFEKKGKTAFVFGDGDDWSARMIWEGIETAMRGTCEQFWEEVAMGSASFENDALIQQSLDILNEIHRYGQEDAAETTYDEAIERFADGEAPFFPQGSWCFQALRQENSDMQVQLIPFPVPENQDQKVTFWIDSNLAIAKQSGHQKEAAEFLNFVSDPENISLYTSAQNAFSCLEGVSDQIPYARVLEQRREDVTVLYEAVGLPREVADFRDSSIRSLFSGDMEARQSYLSECTDLLREYSGEYISMKENTG